MSKNRNNKNGKHIRDELPKVIALPNIGKYSSRKQWEERCWKILVNSRKQLNHFITPYERRTLVMRTAVAHRIQIGKSYKAIGDELWLSPQTISAIKKSLSEAGYRSYGDRGKTERKRKIYSSSRSPRREIRIGMPRKTKYGTIYL